MHVDFAKVYTCPNCGSDNLVTRVSLHIECNECGNLATGFADLKLEQRPIMSITVRGEVYGGHQFVVYSGWSNARENVANIPQDKEIIVIDPEDGIGFLVDDKVYLKQDLMGNAVYRRDDESFRFLDIVTETLDPERVYSGQSFSDLLLQDKKKQRGVFAPVPGEKSLFELLEEALPKEK